MKLGVVFPMIDVREFARDLAPQVEAFGFESLWLGEHTHMPTATVHQYTYGHERNRRPDGFLPDYYRRFPDPYVSLAAAAMVTTTVKLGTAVALPAEHNPLSLAKEIATLDLISEGRLILGAGFGWNAPESENNGVPFKKRYTVFREKVLAMQALWSEETVERNGDHVRFSESWSYPKPHQPGGPPVLIGARLTPRTIGYIVEFGHGCIPVLAFEGENLEQDVAALRHAAEAAGRDPMSLDITVVEPAGGFRGKRSVDVFDSTLPPTELLDRLRRIDVTRLVVSVPVSSPGLTTHALGRYADVRTSEALA
jgi:probable F420-dependent oxidoreductase